MPGAPQTCIKGNGILYSVTGSQDFPRGQDCWRTGSLEGKLLQKGRPSWRTGQGIKDGRFAGIRVFCWRTQ